MGKPGLLFYFGLIWFVSLLPVRASTWQVSQSTLGDSLTVAAERGDLADVADLLKRGAPANFKGNNGWTPYLFAAWGVVHSEDSKPKYLKIMDVLAKNGASPNAIDQYGNSAAHWACNDRVVPLLQTLVKHRAKLNTQNSDGLTPLLLNAIVGNDPVILKSLLSAGADVNAQDSAGWTALHWAAERGQFYAAKTLLKHGANPNAPAKNGDTPLIRAFLGTLSRSVPFVRSADGSVERMPIKQAEVVVRLKIVELLLRNRATVSQLLGQSGKLGSTPPVVRRQD